MKRALTGENISIKFFFGLSIKHKNVWAYLGKVTFSSSSGEDLSFDNEITFSDGLCDLPGLLFGLGHPELRSGDSHLLQDAHGHILVHSKVPSLLLTAHVQGGGSNGAEFVQNL